MSAILLWILEVALLGAAAFVWVRDIGACLRLAIHTLSGGLVAPGAGIAHSAGYGPLLGAFWLMEICWLARWLHEGGRWKLLGFLVSSVVKFLIAAVFLLVALSPV